MLYEATAISVDLITLGLVLGLVFLLLNTFIKFSLNIWNENRLLRDKNITAEHSLTNLTQMLYMFLFREKSYNTPQKLLDNITKQLETPLTKREMEIAEMVCVRGLKNKDVASELNISKNTVNNHVANILRKTNCATKSELITYILNNKIFE